ncbi:MAG: hypothetical protein HYX47_10325 [Burkholderiales bacterium]|nr:hypothetical protein [Burkholderiales bacterium]
MPAADKLTHNFYLSHLTVSPHAGRAGMRNEPLGAQLENLRRLAVSLEVARAMLMGNQVCVLRAFQRCPADLNFMRAHPAAEGRSVEFIAPGFGTPRDICAHLVAQGMVFDRLVNAGDWVQLDIPAFGREARRQLQTGVFEHGQPMRYMEGLL